MLPSQHWASNFKVEAEDIEFISNMLLEKETPLSTEELATKIVENRLQQEVAALEERYAGTTIYNPAQIHNTGQRLLFPNLDYQTAVITDKRVGQNDEYGEFNVIQVTFDDDEEISREFASELQVDHVLNLLDDDTSNALLGDNQVSAEQILEEFGDIIIKKINDRLRQNDDLVHVARKWFPRDLIIETNEGHHHLAEAILDMNFGGPLATETIIKEIGGLGDNPMSLQVSSFNYALNRDQRFEEVGPSGEVMWYLSRMAPAEVQNVPENLVHAPIDYDRDLLSDNMLNMEAEIDDELSPIDIEYTADQGRITIVYPHRRVGSLPLTTQVRHLFPTSEKTSMIWINLIDGQDDEVYEGWVVPEENYVFGLSKFYAKHGIPIGGHIIVKRGDKPDEVIIDFEAYRPRTEWIRLITFKDNNIHFENDKRAIGADYDDLMILGIDDLEALDESVKNIHKQRRSLASLLHMVIPALGKLTPQGTAHIKTIYSAINVLRRCPPGPILATLEANPDFENMGGHYWQLSES